MKSPLPESSALFESYNQNYRGEICGRVIEAGVGLGLFDYLDRPRTLREITNDLNLDPQVAPIFLKILRLLGLVEEKAGSYLATPAGAALFSSRQPFNIAGGARTIRSMLLGPLENISGIIRNGPEISMAAAGGEETWAEAARDGAAWAFHGAAQSLADILESLDGFSGFRSMLDLGGGHGVFSIYAAERNPSLQIKIFDRPQVLKVAEEFITEYGRGKQVRTLAGDYLTDDLGRDYDLILANSTLQFARAADALDSVIKKIFQALKPGGVFVSLHDACPLPGEQTPVGPILDHLAYAMLIGTDITLGRGLIAKTALEQGFRWVRSRPFNSAVGQLDLDIAIK